MSRKRQATLDRPTLKLDQRHFTRFKHGFEVIGTWYQTEDTRWRWKECLVVLPATLPTGRRHTPVIIPLTEAWKWAMHGDVGDPAHVFEKTAEWFSQGVLPGVAGNKRDHMRLLDAINDCLTELIAMPPRPKSDTAAIGDILITKATGETTEHEVRNDV